MSLYKEYIHIESLAKGDKTIRISVWFNDAKQEYASQDVGTKGYYATFVPVEIEDKGTYKIETVDEYSGFKILLLEAKRRSDKSLRIAVEKELRERKEKLLNKFK